ALTTIDIMKGVLRSGTARRHPLDEGRPAFGKTGTQQDNTNAWFVGATRQLSTAVWVGDPDAYTPMVGVPEFLARDVNKVQGGRFPAEIWKAYMDPAHSLVPIEDWDAPPPPARPNARLVLPGAECAFTVVGFIPGGTVAPPPAVEAPPVEAPPAEAPAEDAAEGQQVQGFKRAPEPPAEEPPAEEPPPEPPAETAPPATLPPIPVTAKVDIGTTIDPNNLDPKAPLPTIDLNTQTVPC
ncbi:MAG: hypothetical protein ACR2O6_13965, partial [Ilumatobacteraceae bacterium]